MATPDKNNGVIVDYDERVDVLYVRRRGVRIDVHHQDERWADLAIAVDELKNIVGFVLLDASIYSSGHSPGFRGKNSKIPPDIRKAAFGWFDAQKAARVARRTVNGNS